ncbi:MAG: alpha/beta hydrolase [Myxococcales bacterium]|nr:alpha/beta hydrolase [Myxococcales bacterium]
MKRTLSLPTLSMALLLLLLLALLLGSGGCIKRYRTAPALEFAQLPYRSLDGKTWPHKSIRAKAVAKRYKMKRAPRVVYVELNPSGGQTLVFIHGLGSYLKFWRYQLDTFAAKGYRVIALDLPGYGKSDKPASFPYTMEAMADVVRELLVQLGIRKPVLIGHSMGGQTALSYAIRYPREPRAVVLTSPAGFETFSKREQLWFAKVLSVRLIEDTPEYAIWGGVRRNNFYRWKPDYEWLIEERTRLKKAKQFEQYAYANVKSVTGLARNDFVRESAKKIVAPTLIVYGEKDRLIPNPFMHGGFTRTVMRSGAKKIRGSKLVGLARCGHTVQMDCHDEYNAAVTAYLAQVAPPIAKAPAPVPAPAPPRRAPTSQPVPASRPASQASPTSQPASQPTTR